jgi:hypothetical protein
MRCTRLGYQHREMVQPMVYPFHGRLCLREFAGAAETEGFLSPGVRASMRYDVRIEVLAAFGVVHALASRCHGAVHRTFCAHRNSIAANIRRPISHSQLKNCEHRNRRLRAGLSQRQDAASDPTYVAFLFTCG